MPAPVIQPAFATGELSPALFGRVDLSKWHSGAALLRNFFVDYRGGASNRPGTMLVGPCFPNQINRLIPFQFSTLQTYMLVFSDHKMHVVKNGALVLEDEIVIVTFEGLNPARLTILPAVPPATVWNPGDWIYVMPTFFGVLPTGGMARYAGAFFDITSVLGGNQYVVADAASEDPINGAPFFAILGGGGIQRVYTLATPYAAADLALLKFTQSADVMTICHPNYPTQQLTRTADNAWTITPASFAPDIPAPVAISATPSLLGDNTAYVYVVTAIGANGATESLPCAPMVAANSKTMTSTPGANITLDWNPPAGDPPPLYNVYRKAEVPGAVAAAGQLYGFVGSTTDTGFVDANIGPDFSRTPPQDPGILEAPGDYPSCTNYFQQRQIFAGTLNAPETLYASKTGDFLNMQYAMPSQANDAIVATLVSKQVNAIKHLIAMDSLLAFTSNGAWKIDAGTNGGPVTPSSLDANQQSYNGCSDVPPIIVGRDVLYVQAKGSAVRDLAYNEFVKIYTGTDLSVLASHLFMGHQIVEWAWAEEPYKLIWCVRDDGIVLVFTYLKEQEVYAWTHAVTDGQFKSVATISEGGEDAVYFVVSRFVQGKFRQYIERLASRVLGDNPEFDVPADFTRFRFVDAALATTLTYPQASIYPISGEAEGDGGWWVPQHLMAAFVTVGGAGYTAPTAVIEDETGTGGVIVLTVLAGVITAATVTEKGENYTRPTVRIVDTTGAGADVRAQLGHEMELLADAAVLGGVGVDSLFVGNGGYGFVTRVNSSRSITVDMRQKLANNFPVPAGAWSVTPKVAAVHGLDHLEGREVTILADGNVQPNQVVTDGGVALEAPAAAVVVGLAYTARLESLYCDVPGESPTVQGRRKRIPAVTVRTANSRGLKCGVKGEALTEFKERTDTDLMGDPIRAFTGDRKLYTQGGYDEAGQVVLQQDQPLPATILALIPELTVGDTPSA